MNALAYQLSHEVSTQGGFIYCLATKKYVRPADKGFLVKLPREYCFEYFIPGHTAWPTEVLRWLMKHAEEFTRLAQHNPGFCLGGWTTELGLTANGPVTALSCCMRFEDLGNASLCGRSAGYDTAWDILLEKPIKLI